MAGGWTETIMCTSDVIQSHPPRSRSTAVASSDRNSYTSNNSRRSSFKNGATATTVAVTETATTTTSSKRRRRSSLMRDRGGRGILSCSKTLLCRVGAAVVVCQIFLILAFTTWASVGGDDASSKSTWSFPRIRQERLITLPEAWKQSSLNAYAFLIAGVDPTNPLGYMGYIWNILAAKYIFDFSGSQADVMVMIRMARTSPTEYNVGEQYGVHPKLPRNHEEALRRAGIRIEYLPTPKVDNYFTAQMDKFRLLQFTEYNHIFFMDSDVIPMCNLDYVFEMMDRGEIAQNMVVGWGKFPAQGGFFCLSPQEGDYEAIFQQYIDNYHFDEVNGFGHKITPPDRWESPHPVDTNDPSTRFGRKWDFYGADADQGLLYHWTKYHKMDVTLVIHNRVETWGRSRENHDGEARAKLKWKRRDIFTSCGRRRYEPPSTFFKYAPMSDHFHFSRGKKPFFKDASQWDELTLDNFEDIKSPGEAWFTAFSLAKKQYNIGNLLSDVDMTQQRPEPQLGTHLEPEMIPS